MGNAEIEAKKAQMRKKRRKDKMKRRLIVFVFLFLCAGVIFTVLKAPFFNIKTVVCTGQENLAQEEIIKAANIKTGTNVFTVNITAAKKRVAAIPSVSESNVRRIFPNKIKIWVREAREAAYVRTESGAAIIDKDGKILKVTAEDDEALQNIAELSGIEVKAQKAGEYIADREDIVTKKIFECMDILDRLEMTDKLRRVNADDLSDIKINYDNRLNIYLGGYENMEYKLTFIKKVINENMSEYERADMDYRGDKLYVGPMDGEEEKAAENGDVAENADSNAQSGDTQSGGANAEKANSAENGKKDKTAENTESGEKTE